MALGSAGVRQKINQHPHFQRQMPTRRIERKHTHRSFGIGGQQADKPPCCKAFGQHEIWRGRDAQTRFGGNHAHRGIGKCQPPIDRNLLILRKAPSLWIARIGVEQTIVMRQILGGFGYPIGGQIGRRGGDDQFCTAKFAGNQCGVAWFAHTDRHVKPLIDQIHQTIRELHLERDVGIGFGKAGKMRCKADGAKTERCTEADLATRQQRGIAGFGIQRIKFIQQPAQPVEIGLPRLCRRQRTGGAVQQPHAQIGFEL